MKKHANIPIFIPHLGCPNGCVFCNQRKISGKTAFDRASVRDEIERALSTIPRDIPVQIAYFGGSFTGIDREDMTALLALAGEYVEAGRCASIRLSTRPDYIDGEILAILKSHHVGTVELGIQSMDDRVLAAGRRGHTAEQTRRACALVKAWGFELVGQMMTGLPIADVSSECETARLICEMGADAARIYPTVVFRDTALAEMAARGEYTPMTEADAVARTAAVLDVFLERGVPVIRIGLQAGEALATGEDIACGSYHPAIGELAWSRCFRGRLEAAMCRERATGRFATVRVNPAELSKMVGQHGENRRYLVERFSLCGIRFLPNIAVLPHTFTLQITDGPLSVTHKF